MNRIDFRKDFHMKDKITVFIFLFIVVFLWSNCKRNYKIVRGKVIEIDYRNVQNLKDSSWIKIDNYKFIHFRTLKNAHQNKYPLFTTTMVKQASSKHPFFVSSRTSARFLAKYLQEIKDKSGNRYHLIDSYLVSTKGIIKFTKMDSSLINVIVPEYYPATIKRIK